MTALFEIEPGRFYHSSQIVVVSAIQVCYTFSSEKNQKREISGLFDALNAYNLPSGLIITDDTEEELVTDNKTIKIIPAWKWLLDPES